jgi:hypothetical protein
LGGDLVDERHLPHDARLAAANQPEPIIKAVR